MVQHWNNVIKIKKKKSVKWEIICFWTDNIIKRRCLSDLKCALTASGEMRCSVPTLERRDLVFCPNF